jgi:putative Mg2+ transporter-C (MgtC) family protein
MTDPVLVGRILVALLLSSTIGLEREFRHKPAGVRTIALVGVGAAVAMIVSKYGFGDMHGSNVSLDPSRVAAQIVSGVGFLGAGIIIVRRDSVSGLTTAAVVWGTAMVGMAVGAGMVAIATAATATHLIVAVGYPLMIRHLPGSPWDPMPLSVSYVDHRGVLREVLTELTRHGATVSDVRVDRNASSDDRVVVSLLVGGKYQQGEVVDSLADLEGVLTVSTGSPQSDS